MARPRRNSRDPTRRTTLTARPPSLLRPPPCVVWAACARADPTRPAPSARRSIQDHSVVVALALSTHRGTGAPPVWSSRADNRLSPAGETLCGGECVDTSSELRSCGRCGKDCGAIPHAFGVGCEQGRCVVCAFALVDESDPPQSAVPRACASTAIARPASRLNSRAAVSLSPVHAPSPARLHSLTRGVVSRQSSELRRSLPSRWIRSESLSRSALWVDRCSYCAAALPPRVLSHRPALRCLARSGPIVEVTPR